MTSSRPDLVNYRMKTRVPDSPREEGGKLGKLNNKLNKKDAALLVILTNQVQTAVRIFSLLYAN